MVLGGDIRGCQGHGRFLDSLTGGRIVLGTQEKTMILTTHAIGNLVGTIGKL